MRKNLFADNKYAALLIFCLFFCFILVFPAFLKNEARGANPTLGVTPQETQKKRITGRVTDTKGEPLPGVNIIEEGTQNAAISNVDGIYEIHVNNNASVNFSFIGFEPVKIRVGSSSVYDVILEEQVNELDEMVVTGYGQQRKISSVGAQSSIKAIDIKAPTGSLTNVLAGRLPGIVSVQRTGEPGKDAADIWIRGISTPNSANPLILVDGVERTFNDIDPEDIESLTILKDASATAVYGVRGANGIIIIKTKPGIIGKPSVKVDYYEGFNRFTKSPKLADGIVFMEAANEASYNMGEGEYKNYSQEYIENTRSGTDPLLYPNVNWRKEIFKDWAHSRRINASVRGGSQMAQFFASVSYYNETGMIKTNSYENYDSGIDYDRYNITMNINLQVTSKTKVDIGAQGYLSDGNYPYLSSSDIFAATMEINPVKYPRMFVIDGIQYVPGTHTQNAEKNPYSQATKRGYREESTNKIMSNIRVTQDLDMLLDGLKITGMFAFDAESSRTSTYSKDESTYYFADKSNPYDENGNPVLTTTWEGSTALSFGRSYGGNHKNYFEASVNYDKIFGNDHRVGAMVLYNQESKTYNDVGSIIAAIPYRIQGLAGRATYSWKDRYFGEFNIGYNGGENFPKNRRFGTFPAVGVGWVLSNEPFWTPVKDIFSFFKIRYTYGKVGSSGVSSTQQSSRRFMYLEQYSTSGSYGYNFGTNGRDGVYVSNPKTSLGWEIATKQDLGFDIKMFNDDLSIVFDLFKETRTDILIERSNSLPGYAGFQTVPYGNVGESKTRGMDGNIEYFKRINNDWKLTLRGNFTWAKPEWVYDDNPVREDTPWRNRKGYSITSIEGYQAIGLYTQTDIDRINAWHALSDAGQATVSQPFPTPSNVSLTDVKAGDIMYKDMNEDGKIDDNDKMWLGNGDVPEINYGFGFNLDYKSFSLGLLFQGTAKADRFVSGIVRPFNSSGTSAVYRNIEDRWSESNPDQKAFYPRLAYGNDALGNQNNFLNSSWWVKDMSFFRLKTVQVTYHLPQKWVDKLLFKHADVYMLGMNLFTLSKWKLWDPELDTSDGSRYPNTTSYTIGINFGF